ncbi:hypothetical protein ACVWWG_001817 [Bradyrhizobium sp. LB7.2]
MIDRERDLLSTSKHRSSEHQPRVRYRPKTSRRQDGSSGCIWSLLAQLRESCNAAERCNIGAGCQSPWSLYRRPHTSTVEPATKIYPDLLCGMYITRTTRLGTRHDLHTDGQGLRLFGRGAALGDQPDSVVAAIDDDGGGILCRDTGGDLGRWHTADINAEDGSQFTGGVHRHPRRQRRRRQHGRPGPGGTTCSSSVVAQPQIRQVYLRAHDSVSDVNCVSFNRSWRSRLLMGNTANSLGVAEGGWTWRPGRWIVVPTAEAADDPGPG